MNLLPHTKVFTGSGIIGSGNKPVRIFNVNLLSTATASTCSIKNGGSGGTVFAQLDGSASRNTIFNWAGGLQCPTNGYFTADANISSASITFTEEL